MDAIDNGLVKGMTIVGDKYAVHEMYLPQVLLAADAMYGAWTCLLHFQVESAKKMVGVTIGVVEGDVHDIGKNLVKTMLTAGGFSVTDLGRDVPIETSSRNQGQGGQVALVAMSTLMTPTMDGMKAGHRRTGRGRNKNEGKDDHRRGAMLEEFAESIGCGLLRAGNAQDAVEKLKGAF